MKNLLQLIFAGIIGGMVTFGTIHFTILNKNDASDSHPYSQFANDRINTKAGSSTAPFDFTMAAEKAMPVVVHIKAAESTDLARKRRQKGSQADPFGGFFGDDFFFGNPYDRQKKGTGSGVIISNDGYIVTNNHVVEFADEVEVTLYDNRSFQATVIGTDKKTDLAVIKIEADNLPVLEKANSDRAKVGQWVLAVGNPFDLSSTVTAGIISAKGRDINIIEGQDAIESFIQTDAAVNPGNSGGALIDDQGRLLGINTAIATRTGSFSGYSFAIPVNNMTRVVNDIIEYGSYKRGYLGVSIMDLDNELANELGLSITQGVVIKSLSNGGAAQFAGLLPNDVITRVDNRKIKSAPELQEVVGRAKVGSVITLTINRNGDIKEIPVKLKAS